MSGRATPRAASLFMRRCRQPANSSNPIRVHSSYTTSRSQSSSTNPSSGSRYAPSNFGRPYTSPLESISPYPVNVNNTTTSSTTSNLPGPGSKPAYADPITSPTSHPVPLATRPRALPTPIPPAHSATNFRNWLRRQFNMRIPTTGEIPPDPFNVWNNPYRAHKKWPPNLMELEHTEQLAFEKVFKRRVALKWERPVFKRWVILIQNMMIATVVIYAVLIFDADEGTVFDGVRAWLYGKVKDNQIFPGPVREAAEESQKYFAEKYVKVQAAFFEIVPVEGMRKGGREDGGGVVDPEEWKVPWAQRRKE